MYNPVTRSYGEPHKRPEVRNSTVEFIASSDYMVNCPCLTTRGQQRCVIKNLIDTTASELLMTGDCFINL